MRSNADALVSTGLAAAGYIFCNMDGGWQGGRYSNHSVYANASAFPSGLVALGEYMHARGLLFGGYTDRGPETCDGHTGSLNLEALDAAQYAAWGMDYVKVRRDAAIAGCVCKSHPAVTTQEDSCFATQSHGERATAGCVSVVMRITQNLHRLPRWLCSRRTGAV